MKSNPLNSAYISWLLERPAFAVTLTFNWLGRVTPESARSQIGRFGMLIDRAWLGGRFYKRAAHKRTKFFFLPEKFLDGYPRYHGVIQSPAQGSIRQPSQDYGTQIEFAWKSVVPSGNVCAEYIHDGAGWMDYVTKVTNMNDPRVIHSYDYWPQSRDQI